LDVVKELRIFGLGRDTLEVACDFVGLMNDAAGPPHLLGVDPKASPLEARRSERPFTGRNVLAVGHALDMASNGNLGGGVSWAKAVPLRIENPFDEFWVVLKMIGEEDFPHALRWDGV